ncbi:unnamed protein product [Calypogeia fissa]
MEKSGHLSLCMVLLLLASTVLNVRAAIGTVQVTNAMSGGLSVEANLTTVYNSGETVNFPPLTVLSRRFFFENVEANAQAVVASFVAIRPGGSNSVADVTLWGEFCGPDCLWVVNDGGVLWNEFDTGALILRARWRPA